MKRDIAKTPEGDGRNDPEKALTEALDYADSARDGSRLKI